MNQRKHTQTTSTLSQQYVNKCSFKLYSSHDNSAGIYIRNQPIIDDQFTSSAAMANNTCRYTS